MEILAAILADEREERKREAEAVRAKSEAEAERAKAKAEAVRANHAVEHATLVATLAKNAEACTEDALVSHATFAQTPTICSPDTKLSESIHHRKKHMCA